MTPNQIKAGITKLAEGMKEADANRHDHALHAALSKLHGNHGTRKLLNHLAAVIDESGEEPAYDLPHDPQATTKHLRGLASARATGRGLGGSQTRSSGMTPAEERLAEQYNLHEPGRSFAASDKLRDMDIPKVLGHELDRKTLTPVRKFIDTSKGGDHGADPLGGGKFRMVPSGDIVDFEERNRRLKNRS